MKLHSITIENFRKVKSATIYFGNATFLIGANNVGKSTVLDAIGLLLSDENDKNKNDYWFTRNENEGEIKQAIEIVLTGEFRDVPESIVNERGFNKDRLKKYNIEEGTDESGLSFILRKRIKLDKIHREIQLFKQEIKEEFNPCTMPCHFAEHGIDKELLIGLFGEENFNKRIAKPKIELLEQIPDLWNISSEQDFFENPGGIAGNVLSKLPRFLKIPANSNSNEITKDGKNGAMGDILNELFKDIREKSENYKKAQEYLTLLEKEMNPEDNESEFGKLMDSLNRVVDGVFPTAQINAQANLSDPNKVLNPIFDISMSSNISTPIDFQGTGMVRAAVFSLLKFKKKWEEEKNDGFKRSLIVGFEEPELFLHPNAANKMRDTIYDLADGDTQIICTTHSPYMIDLSQKPNQILNNLKEDESGFTESICFNISNEYKKLQEDGKSYIKMLQKIDDYIARVFFAKKVIVVEGDTDVIVIKNSIKLMPEDIKHKVLSDYQIIKATGKAAMIALIKYLTAMNINIFAIHDEDANTQGAVRFNAPILEALGGIETKRIMMHNCIEDELGYEASNCDKPYKAYEITNQWNSWDDIPNNWKTKIKTIFSEFEFPE